jgi:hypothetical protein
MPKLGRGIGGHTKPNNGRHELWLTPPQILANLGTFDLDPCACPAPRPWPTANRHACLPEDGLAMQWEGRVWLNPPYGTSLGEWMRKMALHQNGISLTFARTETEAWQKWVWPFAKSILFVRGRFNFYLPDGTRAAGNSGGPCALISYTDLDKDILATSGIAGAFVTEWA